MAMDIPKLFKKNWKMVIACIALVFLLWRHRYGIEGFRRRRYEIEGFRRHRYGIEGFNESNNKVNHRHGLEKHQHDKKKDMRGRFIQFNWNDHKMNVKGSGTIDKHRHLYDPKKDEWYTQWKTENWDEGKKYSD